MLFRLSVVSIKCRSIECRLINCRSIIGGSTTFAIFDSENNFHYQLNSLHPSLRFTFYLEFAKEFNQSLTFLDLQEEKVGSKLITYVYRNPYLQDNTRTRNFLAQ